MQAIKKLHWASMFAILGIGILTFLALNHSTQWVVKRNLLFIEGQIIHFDIDVLYESISESLPNTTRSQGTDIDSQVLQAIIKRPEQRFIDLELLSDKFHDDAFVQSELARYALMDWRLTGSYKSPTVLVDHQRARVLMKAAERGSKTEPDNIYFDITKVCGLLSEGNVEDARTTFLNAVNRKQYDDHMSRETKLLLTWYRNEAYLGEYYGPEVLGFGFASNAAKLPMLTRFWHDRGSESDRVKACVAALQIGDQLGKQSHSESVVDAVRTTIQRACPPEAHVQGTQAILAQAELLEGKYNRIWPTGPKVHVLDIVSRNLQITDDFEKLRKKESPSEIAWPLDWITASVAALLTTVAAVGVVGLMAIGQLRWRKLGTELGVHSLLPMAVAIWSLIDPMEFGRADFYICAQIATLTVTLLLCIFSHSRKTIVIFLGLACAVGLLQGGLEISGQRTLLPWAFLDPSMSYAWIVSMTILIPFAMTQPSRPQWLMGLFAATLVLFLSGCIGLGIAFSLKGGMVELGYLIPFIILFVSSLFLAPRPQIRLGVLLGPIILVGSLVYLGFVMKEISVDRQWARAIERDMTRVDRVKKTFVYNRPRLDER